MAKRPFLQIHLSTAIILTLIASAFLWLNLIPDPPFQFVPAKMLHWVYTEDYGWPASYGYQRYETPIMKLNREQWRQYPSSFKLNWVGAIAVNLLVLLALLAAVTFVWKRVLQPK
jgi:hypothetical protein